MRVFRNDGAGTFDERDASSGLDGITGGLNLVHADYDNDGLPRHPGAARRLDGRGGPVPDVAAAQPRRTAVRRRDHGRRALLRLRADADRAWFDYDGDGWLDLFVGNECRRRRPKERFTRASCSATTATARSPRWPRRSASTCVGFVKGVVERRLRQRRPARPLRVGAAGAEPPVPQRRPGSRAAAGASRTSPRRRGRRRSRSTASRRCSSTTTTTAGSTSTSAATLGSREDVAADYLGLDDQRRAQPPLSQPRRRHVRRRDAEAGALTRHAGHGPQLRRPRQRRLARLLRRHRQPRLRHARAQPHVPQRRRASASRTSPPPATSATCRRATASRSADVDNDGDQDMFEQIGGAYQADRAYSALFENPTRPPRAGAEGRLDQPGARRRRPRTAPRIGARVDGPAADAGRAAPHASRRLDRRQLRLVAVPRDLRRPRRPRPRSRRIDVTLAGRPDPARARAAMRSHYRAAFCPGRHYLLKQGAARAGRAEAPTLRALALASAAATRTTG